MEVTVLYLALAEVAVVAEQAQVELRLGLARRGMAEMDL
jgi:hypothetical protein